MKAASSEEPCNTSPSKIFRAMALKEWRTGCCELGLLARLNSYGIRSTNLQVVALWPFSTLFII